MSKQYHRLLATGGTLVVVLFILISEPMFALDMPWAQGHYHYYDDFSTTKAETDSYQHSGISEPPCPDFSFYGHLCYLPDSLGNRGLAFFCGFELACAHLHYRFPLGDEGLDITGGVVTFEIKQMPDAGGVIKHYHSYDGTSWTLADSIGGPGSYEYTLTPPPTCEWAYIRFRGGGLLLDDLSVTLDYATATDASTWGSIKALFE
jgi:hypothetical protein